MVDIQKNKQMFSPSYVSHYKISPKEDKIVVIHHSNSMEMWDVKKDSILFTFDDRINHTSIAFTPDGSKLISDVGWHLF